jgi:hypothetical protein
VVIGDSDTRVSPVKGKHSNFVTKIDFLSDETNENESSLFDK